MTQLDAYFALQKEIYDYFGYVEDWVVIPLDDRRDMIWKLVDGNSVHYWEKGEETDLCEDIIYTQCHLPKWVYRGKDYTMICVDTHTDGNKFLQIFSNDKESQTLE